MVHYAGEAMADGIAGEMSRGSVENGTPAADADVRRFLAQLEDRLSRLGALESAAEADADAVRVPALPPSVVAPSEHLVFNRESEVLHRTVSDADLSEMKAYCGWKFLGRKHSVWTSIPENFPWRSICPRCMRFERNQARAACGEISDPE